MTEANNLTRPRTAPTRRTRKNPFTQPDYTAPPLYQFAPYLGPTWTKDDTDTPDRTALYTHPEGHRIGLRLQTGDLIIQTWITAGPELPTIPDGTDEEQAEAQATNDARLQPGRTWHTTVATRHAGDLATAVADTVHDHLIPALTHKPKKVRPTASTTTETSKETPK